MLSICVTVKNRSLVELPERGVTLNLFPRLVRSLANLELVDAELVVSDWLSDDWPLREWLPANVSVPYRIVDIHANRFSRGYGLNVAARHARGDVLFFTDADMLLATDDVIQKGLEVVAGGESYFPICYSFTRLDQSRGYRHSKGEWRKFGFGNLVVGRNRFHALGGWLERWSYGCEDLDMHARLLRFGVVRDTVDGFYHQWHPVDRAWKKRFV